jgi:hypothetical protein
MCHAHGAVNPEGVLLDSKHTGPVVSPDGRFELRLHRVPSPPTETEEAYEEHIEVVETGTGRVLHSIIEEDGTPAMVVWDAGSSRCAVAVADDGPNTQLFLLIEPKGDGAGDWSNYSLVLKDLLPAGVNPETPAPGEQFPPSGMTGMTWRDADTLLCRYIWNWNYYTATVKPGARRAAPAI